MTGTPIFDELRRGRGGAWDEADRRANDATARQVVALVARGGIGGRHRKPTGTRPAPVRCLIPASLS